MAKKYIDAERLRAEIEKRLKNVRDYINGVGMKYKGLKYYKMQGKESAYDALLNNIDSLQQDETQVDKMLCSQVWWEEKGWIMIPPDATVEGIDSLLRQVKKKLQQEQPIKVYRVENEKESKGLWRKFDGTWEPLFDMLTDGQCKDMPMEDSPIYREGGKRWFASAPSKETLQKWFSRRDLEELTAAGFTITEFEVLEYRKLSDFEYIFTRESIVNKTNINVTDIYPKEQPDFPTTDEQMKEFLATHPKIKVPEKYKNPDWLFKKLEQPEVDLEKEINKEISKWTCYEEIGFGARYDAKPFDGRDIEKIARHFYELGLNARKEE